jgi:hypothetical protein
MKDVDRSRMTMIASSRLAADSTIIRAVAHLVSGVASLGLKASRS